MITDQEIERCFDFLLDSAIKIAEARHNKVYTDEMRKVVWSTLRRESDEKTQAEHDAYAYAHPKYQEHLKAMAEAEKQYELLRSQREAAKSKVEAWRTFSANERGAHRAVA